MRSKPVRDHPLANNDGKQGYGFGASQSAGLMLDKKNYEVASTAESGEDNSDDETGGILDKVKNVSKILSI